MSELTDLQICKRIADIEGLNVFEVSTALHGTGKEEKSIIVTYQDRPGEFDYNPLTDNALCFQLMVKYKIKPYYKDIPWPPMKDDFSAMPLPVARDSNEELTTFRGWVGLTNSETLNKSICLAIIEAHKLTLQKESNK